MSPRPAPRGAVRVLAAAPLLLAALLIGDVAGILRPPAAVDCSASAALVMGAAQYDGRPSPAFERRLARALELYRSGCVERIVVSGGGRPGDRSTEGATGVRWLRERGVPREALAAETAATTSAENVLFSRPLLGESAVLIVTDDLHAWRATWLARRFGVEARAAGVATGAPRPAYVLRELAAMAAYRAGWLR